MTGKRSDIVFEEGNQDVNPTVLQNENDSTQVKVKKSKEKRFDQITKKYCKPFMEVLRNRYKNLLNFETGELLKEQTGLLHKIYKIDVKGDVKFDEYRQMVFYYFHKDFGTKEDPKSIFSIFAVCEGYLSNKIKDFPENWLSNSSKRPNNIHMVMFRMICLCKEIEPDFLEYFNLENMKKNFREELEVDNSVRDQRGRWGEALLEESVKLIFEKRTKFVNKDKEDFKEECKRRYDEIETVKAAEETRLNGKECNFLELAK